MDELIKNLNEVLAKSKDGFTCYWVGQAIAKLSAASPQVVADEHKAFEAHINDNGAWPRAAERSVDGGCRLMATAVAWNTWRAATDSFVSRSATPVQEQVAGKPCPYCGSTDGAHDKAYPHPRAPVQPVAIPDGKPFAHFVQPSGFGPFIECHPNQVGSFPSYRAAPAAQGDAIEDELTKIVKSGAEKDFPGFLEWIADRLVYVHSENNNVDYVQTLRTRTKQLRAALAAKAAS